MADPFGYAKQGVGHPNDVLFLNIDALITYDNAGNHTVLTQQTDEGTKTSQYFYDPLYQLKKVISPDGSLTSYTYDPVGNRTEMVKEEGDKVERTKYSYNEANELTSLIKDGDDEATRFQYDGNGNLTARIQPGDRRTDYTFDMANRLAKVELHQGKWMEFLYNGDGDLISKISAMKSPGQGKGNGKEHWDNGKGNDADWVPPGQAKKQNEQLINVLLDNGNGNGGEGNNGNGNGNDKDKDNNGKHNGESKSKKEKKEKKEKRNKEKWQKPDPNQPQLYEVTNYLLDEGDPSNQVLMTYDDYDQYKAAYAYGLERTEVQALDDTRPEAQDPLYYLYDGLGSVMQLTRPNGEVRDHYRYDEFGVPAPGAKLSEDGRKVNHNSFGYTGELWEEDVDLLYLRSRHYMPETGRFMSRDTYYGSLQEPQSRHLYVYVKNNPINFTDPFGFKGILSIFAHEDHAFLVFSPEGSDITIKDAYVATVKEKDYSITKSDLTVKSGQTVTIGTWGNKPEHEGIIYNLEKGFINEWGAYQGRVSLSVSLTDNQQKALFNFITKNDSWGLYDNCANFAADAWVAAGQVDLDEGTWPRPSVLAKSIKKHSGYKKDALVDIPGKPIPKPPKDDGSSKSK